MKTTKILKLMTAGLLILAATVFLAACSSSADEASPAGDLAEHVDDSSDADGGADPTGDADTDTDAEEHSDGDADADADLDHDADDADDAAGSHGDGNESGMLSAHVSLTEWAILGEGEEPIESLPSGDVMLEVHNDGIAVHQFAVWRGGEVVGDEVQGGELVAETDFISPGGMTSLDVTLEPGQYVLTCPVVGHTQRGMHSDAAVEIEVQ